ncbi:hypothetical protein GCM10023238_22650 [Streptomyces heliomycini]
MSYALLDPASTDEHGEWPCTSTRGGAASSRTGIRRSAPIMQEMYQYFHSAVPSSGFVNDTTRALDADVERAREGP